MKKQIVILMAAAAVMVGCQREDAVNEPSGADRDTSIMRTNEWNTTTNSLDTNSISEPSGAARTNDSSLQGTSSEDTSSSTNSNSSSQEQDSSSSTNSGTATP